MDDILDGDSGRSRRMAWVVSYADIMTIILTFFILILSISRVSPRRYEALQSAFGQAPERSLEEVQAELDTLVSARGLSSYVETRLTDDGLYIELANSILFASGEAELEGEVSTTLLQPIGGSLAALLEEQYGVVVEGYTDDVPIHNARFRSNWELSTSRAIYVMEQLLEGGFPSERLSVQGFADTRVHTDPEPQDDANLADARARERRVVLRVIEHRVPERSDAP